ncbi:MAG: succinate dehydrogenase/fumarate reductase iron-sulfur subunit, partial [Bacteroidales bacterium]|nr:succinate dehydrogenase/fumarate reductase iron-sulfur subunit [Bacteroidales bacterium]
MDLKLKIWRQENAQAKGEFKTYDVAGVSSDSSFLEMLDVLNESIVDKVETPVCFDHDCREGICGMCSLYINGRPHGPDDAITTCQLHMRKFKDGDTITIEPWRASPFPVIKDLVVDRSALDSLIQSGGYTSASTGGVPDANAILIDKYSSDLAMDA